MKPLPTNEIATSFAPARPGTPRAFDKAKGESDAKIRSPDARSDREVKHASRTSAKDADKPIDDGEQTQTATTFDEVVNDIVDGKVETSGATMELASTQVSALSTELAALLQGIPAPSRADTAAANSADANPTTAAPEAAAQTIGDADDEMTRLAEQLAARAVARNRVAAPANDSIVRPALAVADTGHGAAPVSVAALQEKTGFDGAVKVTANNQKWFQTVAPALTGVSNSMTRADGRSFSVEPASSGNSIGEVVSSDRASPLLENSIEGKPSLSDQSFAPNDRNDSSSRDSTRRGQAAAISGVGSPALGKDVSAMAAPYQQIRAAVAEAIVGANSAQRTDYVSLYADRPTSSTLMLKTLEISLEPPDLGRVNVKMNLASRDLKLEIEASKASTAEMLSNDQASLKLELLNDNADLSSVLVSVTSAVSDAGPARGAGNGDQQFAGNARTANDNTFASTTGGGRDDRQQPQQSAHEENSGARTRGGVNADTAGTSATGKALYI